MEVLKNKSQYISNEDNINNVSEYVMHIYTKSVNKMETEVRIPKTLCCLILKKELI